MVEGRVKYGCSTCIVQDQSPHLEAVLIVDTFVLHALVTQVMFV